MEIRDNFDQWLLQSEPGKYQPEDLSKEEMLLNVGPQHPSTHGVLRLEVISNGEWVKEVVPHIGYLHRCFEKHAEALSYPQIIPYTDRMDYLSSMNNNFAFVLGVEKMMGLTEKIPKRISYIRVLMAELNRIASHLVALGTYGLDIGAFTPFLWTFRDREHIVGLMEWVSGARLLYNYMWVGGLFHELPVGFEARCKEFLNYFRPKLDELDTLITDNKIFVKRTAKVGVLPLATAVNYACSGPMLRASGLRWDLRKVDGYSVYPEIDFSIPIGEGEMGKTGDCWDRFKVKVDEIRESVHIVEQCLEKLEKQHKRDPDFDVRKLVPGKVRPKAQELYFRAENPRGELGFYFIADGKSDKPFRCKARGPSFCNLSVLEELCRGVWLADLIAIVGSIDIVLGEVDR